MVVRPIGGAIARSGPLTFDPVTAALPAGENGEDVLARWLLGWGTTIPRSREWFVAWWEAAARAISDSPADRLPVELQPRNFVVTPDRVWHFVAQDLTMRFALPREVLAFRGVVDLLLRRVLPAGWILTCDPTRRSRMPCGPSSPMSVSPWTRRRSDLWVELEADILVRTGPNPDREEHRRRCRAVLGRPVAEMLADLPLSRHVDSAALLADRSREIRWLNEELSVARRDIDGQRAESEELRAALEAMREESAQQAAQQAAEVARRGDRAGA